MAALAHPSAGVRRNAVQVLPHDTRLGRSPCCHAGLLSDSDAQVRLAALLAWPINRRPTRLPPALAVALRQDWPATTTGWSTRPRPPRPGTTVRS